MNQILSLRRIGFLSRISIYNNWRMALISAGAVNGFILLLAIIKAIFDSSVNYMSYLELPLFFTAIITASMAFLDLHNKNKNDDFLLLPASALEKTIVRLVGVSVVVPLFAIIVVTTAALISEIVRTLVFGLSFNMFNPFSLEVLMNWIYLIAVQSVFFLGAAWFKKAHAVKTALSVVVLTIILGLIAVLIFRIVFHQSFSNLFTFSDLSVFNGIGEVRIWHYFHSLTRILKILFTGVFPIFCWMTAWICVKETQSSDGI